VKVVITGGAGFIGCNAAARVLRRGDEAIVIDNLSRPGARHNLEWLRGLGLRHFSSIDLRYTGEIQSLLEAHRVPACHRDTAVTIGGRSSFDFESPLCILRSMEEKCRKPSPRSHSRLWRAPGRERLSITIASSPLLRTRAAAFAADKPGSSSNNHFHLLYPRDWKSGLWSELLRKHLNINSGKLSGVLGP